MSLELKIEELTNAVAQLTELMTKQIANVNNIGEQLQEKIDTVTTEEPTPKKTRAKKAEPVVVTDSGMEETPVEDNQPESTEAVPTDDELRVLCQDAVGRDATNRAKIKAKLSEYYAVENGKIGKEKALRIGQLHDSVRVEFANWVKEL